MEYAEAILRILQKAPEFPEPLVTESVDPTVGPEPVPTVQIRTLIEFRIVLFAVPAGVKELETFDAAWNLEVSALREEEPGKLLRPVHLLFSGRSGRSFGQRPQCTPEQIEKPSEIRELFRSKSLLRPEDLEPALGTPHTPDRLPVELITETVPGLMQPGKSLLRKRGLEVFALLEGKRYQPLRQFGRTHEKPPNSITGHPIMTSLAGLYRTEYARMPTCSARNLLTDSSPM